MKRRNMIETYKYSQDWRREKEEEEEEDRFAREISD